MMILFRQMPPLIVVIGGPLFNLDGEVIGINTAIFSQSGGSVGIGFAIAANLASNVVDQLTQFGQTRRGWLGVFIQEITLKLLKTLALKMKAGAYFICS